MNIADRYNNLTESREYKERLAGEREKLEQFELAEVDGKSKRPTQADVLKGLPDELAQQLKPLLVQPLAVSHRALAGLRETFAAIAEGEARREELPQELAANREAQAEARATIAEVSAALRAWDGEGAAPDVGPRVLAERSLATLRRQERALQQEQDRLFRPIGATAGRGGTYAEALERVEELTYAALRPSFWQAHKRHHDDTVAEYWDRALGRVRRDAMRDIDARIEREREQERQEREQGHRAARAVAQRAREAVTA